MVLEHQREVFHEMLRCRESSHETLDKRVKWRIESHLEEMLQHFQLLAESAAQAKFWVRPCRSAPIKRALDRVLITRDSIDRKLDQCARRRQHQSYLRLYRRHSHLPSSLVRLWRDGNEHI